MEPIKAMVKGGLVTLVLCLVVALMVLVMSEFGPLSQAQSAAQPVVTSQETETHYLPLTDAPPYRDITTQRFAPLSEAQ